MNVSHHVHGVFTHDGTMIHIMLMVCSDEGRRLQFLLFLHVPRALEMVEEVSRGEAGLLTQQAQ